MNFARTERSFHTNEKSDNSHWSIEEQNGEGITQNREIIFTERYKNVLRKLRALAARLNELRLFFVGSKWLLYK